MTGALEPCFKGICQKGLDVCYCVWGCHPDPRLGPTQARPGPIPGPGPVQIRHVLCFTAFQTHPDPEVGAIPARPGPRYFSETDSTSCKRSE